MFTKERLFGRGSFADGRAVFLPESLHSVLGAVAQHVAHGSVPRPGFQLGSRSVELAQEVLILVQLEPKNCGSYGDGGEYWCFIEGMADAVRVACGCFEQNFQSQDRPRADTWRKGYRVTGYFLYWLMLNKDKDFLRKFNRSAVELKPWSWDKAMKHILGDKPQNTTDALGEEYQKAIGEK